MYAVINHKFNLYYFAINKKNICLIPENHEEIQQVDIVEESQLRNDHPSKV